MTETGDVRPDFDPHLPHRYFMSYTYQDRTKAGGFGFGNYAISLALPMTGVDDVRFVTEQIKQSNPTFTDVVILGWQKFEDLS